MTLVTEISQLEALYGSIPEAALIKVRDHITHQYQRLIEAAPFVALATIGPQGLDCSPRGDAGQAVFVRDRKTLLIPDRPGNNRLDSLRNIVLNPQIALLLLIPGTNTTLRVNGTAVISIDPDLLTAHSVGGKAPRSVIIITIQEIYFQCAKALKRAGLWDPERFHAAASLPSPGEIMQELKEDFNGRVYETE
uniref:MSMEG_1061 family FMN-dependent PPOX-type flavoprotein n=1 Tax=Pararhizobium sp. IMCC3301 TaxID=3067904 RepID=UPI002742028F|nr:MSMEG_1061 family FMN-dependent PPOX-type flavoprotein [Pararhizobium sp. IMCC3301]